MRTPGGKWGLYLAEHALEWYKSYDSSGPLCLLQTDLADLQATKLRVPVSSNKNLDL